MNNFDANTITQPHIRSLAVYQPGMSVDALTHKYGLASNDVSKLASNENPLGASEKAKVAAAHALNSVNRYPDGQALTQALSAYNDIQPSQIVLGNGSNDVLDLIARVFLGAGTEAVSSQYAFNIFELASQAAGATNIIVPAKNLGHDIDGMISKITSRTRVLWIANPNNPTGTFIPHDELKNLLHNIPKNIVIVLDHAYYEYLPSEYQINITDWLNEFPNLIITRTFSKIHGLAGLRIGYGMTHPTTAELLNRVRQPFNANSVALAAAVAALDDASFVQKSYIHNQEGLATLSKIFKRLDIPSTPSYANFMTIEHTHASKIHEKLLRQGIIVRPLASQGLTNHLRVSVGTDTELQRLEKQLSIILSEITHE